jgi:hypothetical protein
MNDKINYLTYTRTEMYYDCILPIQNILYDKSIEIEDKLIFINEIIKDFNNKKQKP